MENQLGSHGNYGHRLTALEAAANLEHKGFGVIPLREPYKHVLGSYLAKKNGKYPASILPLVLSYFGRRANIRAFARRPNANIAILTGQRYNLVIIDVDFPQGGKSSLEKLDLPSTLTVQTGNGLHLYFRHPGGKVPTCAGRFAPGIDVKGERSYATAPPSLHFSGARYQWLDESADVAELPPAIADRLRRLPHRGLTRELLYTLALIAFLLPVSSMLATLVKGFRQEGSN